MLLGGRRPPTFAPLADLAVLMVTPARTPGVGVACRPFGMSSPVEKGPSGGPAKRQRSGQDCNVCQEQRRDLSRTAL
jgi:hypothetical protein